MTRGFLSWWAGRAGATRASLLKLGLPNNGTPARTPRPSPGPLAGQEKRRPPRPAKNAAASLPPARPRHHPGPRETVLLADGLTKEVVELAHLDAFDQRGDFRMGVDQRGAIGVSRVPDGELVTAQLGQLDAGALRVTGTALTPAGPREFRGRHSVVRFHSSMTSSSIPLKISIVRSGDSPSTLRRSITSVYFSTSSRLSR